MRYETHINRAEYAVASGKLTILALRLEALLRKYDPAQPRVPAGQSTGGRWVGGVLVAGTWDETKRAECELQYKEDIFQCEMLPWNPFCRDQARSRMTACMKGDPIPPFFHVGQER